MFRVKCISLCESTNNMLFNSSNFLNTSKSHLSKSARNLTTIAEVKNDNVSEKPLLWHQAKPYSEIPGTKTTLENIRSFLPGGKLYNVSLKDLHQTMNKKYGDLAKLKGFLGKPDFVFAFNPKDIEKVYRNEGLWPNRREFQVFAYFRRNIRPDIYGDNAGLLVEHEEKWKELRGKVNPVMMQPRVVKQYIKSVEDVSDDFISKMAQMRDPKQELPSNFIIYLNKWALESISSIALDTRLGCLEDSADKNSDSEKMIRSVHDFLEMTFKLEFFPSFWKYVSTPGFVKLMNALDTITNISLKKVDEAVERIKNNPNAKPESEASVLEKLLKIDKKVAVVMAMDMLLAGVDTTSNSTAFLLYFLATNQKCQDKLREEISTILPNKDSHVNNESFHHLPYLRACMKESSRILPIIGGTVRKVPVDIVLSGYQIPKGTEVVLSHLTTSMKDSQFPEPEKFLPERWLSSQESEGCPLAKNAHPFSHMPFGFGPRSCVGKRFADLEMETFIMKLLRNYKIEWNYGELKVTTKLVAHPETPLKFKLTEI